MTDSTTSAESIIRADLGDAAEAARVLAVQRAAYALEARLMGFDALPPANETLAGLQACGEELWLCEQDGRLLGAVGLEEAPGALVIARLFGAPEAQRRGIGRALVRHALARAGGRTVRTGSGAANARRWRSTSGSGSAAPRSPRWRRGSATWSSYASEAMEAARRRLPKLAPTGRAGVRAMKGPGSTVRAAGGADSMRLRPNL